MAVGLCRDSNTGITNCPDSLTLLRSAAPLVTRNLRNQPHCERVSASSLLPPVLLRLSTPTPSGLLH
jgi:hypothetical protein